ncbi:DUF3817 domain-containing protein [Corynebacterium halotolerans]|uniref:DUF3817 domain-containing protein n=1 Tax=Corynebacterium halotolerans TaxID=225326 RepID=UPI003CECF9F6
MTQQQSPVQQVHPERKRRVRTALTLFSISAWVTGVFLILLVIRMIMEYLLNMELPGWTTLVAIFHGWAYLIFVICTFNLGLKARWQPVTWLVTVISGVVPFLSFWVENRRRHEVTTKFQLNQS